MTVAEHLEEVQADEVVFGVTGEIGVDEMVELYAGGPPGRALTILCQSQ